MKCVHKNDVIKNSTKTIPKAIFSYNVMAWRSIQITLNPE